MVVDGEKGRRNGGFLLKFERTRRGTGVMRSSENSKRMALGGRLARCWVREDLHETQSTWHCEKTYRWSSERQQAAASDGGPTRLSVRTSVSESLFSFGRPYRLKAGPTLLARPHESAASSSTISCLQERWDGPRRKQKMRLSRAMFSSQTSFVLWPASSDLGHHRTPPPFPSLRGSQRHTRKRAQHDARDDGRGGKRKSRRSPLPPRPPSFFSPRPRHLPAVASSRPPD